MNTNGGGIHENDEAGHHSDPQQMRQRGNQRRSRGRQNYERPINGRGNRDRRSHNWRDGSSSHPSGYSAPSMPAVIDVDDDVQFPSITGASSNDSRRTRSQAPPSTHTPSQINQSGQTGEYGSSTAPRSNYMSYQSDTYAYSGQPRYNSNNRGRGSRYQQQGRGYPNANTYNRRPNNNRPPAPSMYGLPAVQYVPAEATYPRPQQGPSEQSREKPDIDCVHQVEYYFSDTNLVSDQYLRSQMDDEGYVDLKLVHSFKRISTLNLPFEEFVEKLKGSDKLDLLEEGLKVRAKNDSDKWVGFTRFLRERNIGDIQGHEYTKLYVSYMKRTYGPQTHIPQHLLNPPPPKSKSVAPQYVPAQYPILPYVEPVHGSVPYYAFPPGDPSMMYPIGNPYQFQFPAPYQDYAVDYSQGYYADPNFYTDQFAPQERYEASNTDASSSGNVDSIMNMVNTLKIDEPQQNKDNKTS